MEIHKTNQKYGTVWVTKVESESVAMQVIASDSGYYPNDIRDEIKATGSFDAVNYSYKIVLQPA